MMAALKTYANLVVELWEVINGLRCPHCQRVDYEPLADGSRRCHICGQIFGEKPALKQAS